VVEIRSLLQLDSNNRQTLHHVFAVFSLYTDVTEPSVGEHTLLNGSASSIAGEISAPITRPEAPTIGNVISAASPVPVQISSARHVGATSAAVRRAGTKSRDHRPTRRSYAGVSTARPGATWRPGPKFVFIMPRNIDH
jgi:hypothetical protein